MSMKSAVVRIKVKPGRGDEVIAAFEGARAHVAAEAGTLLYTLHRSDVDENVFFVTEIYADQAALDAHMGGPAMGALAGIADAVEEGGVDLQFATPVVSGKG